MAKHQPLKVAVRLQKDDTQDTSLYTLNEISSYCQAVTPWGVIAWHTTLDSFEYIKQKRHTDSQLFYWLFIS